MTFHNIQKKINKIITNNNEIKDFDYRFIRDNIDEFIFYIISIKDKNIKDKAYKVIKYLVENYHDIGENKSFINIIIKHYPNIEKNEMIFAYIIGIYLTSDPHYNSYIIGNIVYNDNFDIITKMKTIQKCLLLIFNLCKNGINNEFIDNYVNIVGKFNGDFNDHIIMKNIFNEILLNVNLLKNYKFNIMIPNLDESAHMGNIYSFIIHELSDCGDELEFFETELVNFLNVLGIDQVYNAIDCCQFPCENDWIHDNLHTMKKCGLK